MKLVMRALTGSQPHGDALALGVRRPFPPDRNRRDWGSAMKEHTEMAILAGATSGTCRDLMPKRPGVLSTPRGIHRRGRAQRHLSQPRDARWSNQITFDPEKTSSRDLLEFSSASFSGRTSTPSVAIRGIAVDVVRKELLVWSSADARLKVGGTHESGPGLLHE